jgi:hypothetical protein
MRKIITPETLKGKKMIILWALAIILAPMIILPIFILLLKFTLEIINFPYPVIYLDFNTTVNVIDYFSIYFSIVGIAVSVIIAYYLYKLSKEKEMSDLYNYRATIYTQTRESILAALADRFDRISITESTIENSFKLKEVLDDKKHMQLTNIWTSLLSLSENDKKTDDRKSEFQKMVCVPFYNTIWDYPLESKSDLLNKEIYSLLFDVNPLKNKVFKYGEARLVDGSLCYLAYEVDNTQKYKVYKNDRLIYDCSFENNKVKNGYAERILYNQKYLGNFENGLFHGEGTLYSTLIQNEKILKQGIWFEGKLREGMMFDIIKSKSVFDIFHTEHYFVVDIPEGYSMDVKVIDLKILGDGTHIESNERILQGFDSFRKGKDDLAKFTKSISMIGINMPKL